MDVLRGDCYHYACSHLYEDECSELCRVNPSQVHPGRRNWKRRRARTRWSQNRQYALRCRENGWQTPQGVVMAHYRMVSGRRLRIPCGCPVCLESDRDPELRPWWVTPKDATHG